MLRILAHIRRHLVGYVALFVALSGSTYAGVRLTIPPNSVGTAQLKNGAVTRQKFARSAVRSLRGPAGSRGPQGPQGSQGPQGPAGADGTVATYPWQLIRSGAPGEPIFQNGWHNTGGDWATAAMYEDVIRVDDSDVVHLRGSISGGTVNTSSSGDAFYFCTVGAVGAARAFAVPTTASDGSFAPGEVVITRAGSSDGVACPAISCSSPGGAPGLPPPPPPPPDFCVVKPVEVRVTEGANGRVSLDGISFRLGGAENP